MKQLPNYYSQRDPAWSAQRLGTVNATNIGGEGCYLTSMAMAACYFGHTITPPALDDIFTNQGLYVDGNELTDNDLSKVFSDITYVGTEHYENTPADLGRLQQLNSDPETLVILEVDFNPEQAGLQTHFVVCVDCDGSSVHIADPWYGSQDDDVALHYGDAKTTIQKFVVYKGTPVKASVPVPADTFEQLVGKSTKYDAFYGAGYPDVQAVLDKLSTDQQQIAQLQKSILTLNQKISDMAKVIDTDARNDYDLGVQIKEVSEQRDGLQAVLDTVCDRLGLPTTRFSIDANYSYVFDKIKALQAPVEEAVAPIVKQHNELYDLFFEQGLGLLKRFKPTPSLFSQLITALKGVMHL